MSTRMISRLTALAVLLAAAMPARAALVYDNGLVNGTNNAWSIALDSVSDSFSVSYNTSLVSAQIGLWLNPGDTPVSVDWLIGTSPFGSDVASGTSTLTNTYEFTNGLGADIYESTFALSAAVSTGTTYYLTLQNMQTVDGSNAFWDETDGPSTAYIDDTGNQIGSESFQLYDSLPMAAPEPAGLTLLALGAPGLLALARRSLRKA